MDGREYSLKINEGSFKPLIDLYKWIINLTCIFISASFAVYTFVISPGIFSWFFYLGWIACIVVIVLSFTLVRYYSTRDITFQLSESVARDFNGTWLYRICIEIFLLIGLLSLSFGTFCSLSNGNKLKTSSLPTESLTTRTQKPTIVCK